MKQRGGGRVITLLFFLLAIGVLLRMPGYDGRAFWVDELWRANLILDKGSISRYWNEPDLYTAITAPLYLVSNNLQGWVDTSPQSLRLSSLLPGLASIALGFFIARKAGAGLGWSAGAAVLFIANAEFIHYSNEFKPYMFEVMTHLFCMYLWLDLLNSRLSTKRQWILFSCTLFFAAFCAANIVFVLPAMAISLADKVLSQEREKLTQFLVSFFAIGCAVIGLYFFVWSYGSDKGLISYWADGFYDVTRGSYPVFATRKLLEMWKGGFHITGSVGTMLKLGALGFACILYACWKRRLFLVQPARGMLIYGFVLVVTVLTLNRMGLWPIGEIRPNLFLFAIFAAWWGAFISIALSSRVQLLMAVLVAVAAMVGTAKTSRTDFTNLGPPLEQNDRVWAAFSTSAPAGKSIIEQCIEKPVTVFINPAMSHAYRYYADFGNSVKISSVLTSQCAAVRFVPDAYINADSLRKQIAAEQPLAGLQWYLFSHLSQEEVDALKAVAQEFGSLQPGENFRGAGYFSVIGRKASK